MGGETAVFLLKGHHSARSKSILQRKFM